MIPEDTSPAPAVSVVIPAYNREKTIARAVESALAQTFRDIEIIVVDDGSRDGTVKVLESFGDRIRLIRKQNGGVSSARNAGIHAARGRWIALLDSDDEWTHDKLSLQMDCLAAYPVRVCFSRCQHENGVNIADVDALEPAKSSGDFLLFSDARECMWKINLHPQIQSILVEREILFKAGLFDESLYVAEDTRLIYNLAFLSEFAYVNKPSVRIHRGTDNSLTTARNPEAARKRLSSYYRVQSEAYWRMMEVDPQSCRDLRKRMSYFLSRRVEIAIGGGDMALARHLSAEGISLAADPGSLLRSLLFFVWPGLWKGRFQRKWYGTSPDHRG